MWLEPLSFPGPHQKASSEKSHCSKQRAFAFLLAASSCFQMVPHSSNNGRHFHTPAKPFFMCSRRSYNQFFIMMTTVLPVWGTWWRCHSAGTSIRGPEPSAKGPLMSNNDTVGWCHPHHGDSSWHGNCCSWLLCISIVSHSGLLSIRNVCLPIILPGCT